MTSGPHSLPQDLLSSPADNVLNVKYFSLASVRDDPLNMEEDAFSLLGRLASCGRRLDDIFWVFPAVEMSLTVAQALAGTGVGSTGRIYMLLQADTVAECLRVLRLAFTVEVAKFSKPKDGRLFNKKRQLPFTLLTLTRFPIPDPQ